MGLQVTDKCYEHIPEKVINVKVTTIIWDVPVITDQTILANRPDLVLHDKKQKTCLNIDTAIQDDLNANTKEIEQVQRPGDQGQQDVENENKNSVRYNWGIRNN
jgi:hypothetical protein